MSINPKMITTALELTGYEIVENLGIVRGLVVRSRSIIGNFFGDIQSIFGGNITIYSELCEHARSDAYNDMVTHARLHGANAVIGFRYDATEIAPGLTEVLAYGTACVVRPLPQKAPSEPALAQSAPKGAAEVDNRVDLNRATEAQLLALPGVNPELAKVALAYRAEHGRFASLEDFTDLLGLDPHQVQKIATLMRVL